MKKRWIAMGTTLVMIAAMAIPTLAAVDYETARLRPDFTIEIDGKEMNFKRADGSAAFALVYEDATYLPLRAIGEALGRNVNWDEETKTITLEGERTVENSSNKAVEGMAKNVMVQVRKDFTIIIDGTERTFRTSAGKEIFPLLYDGSTYLPLRAIGEIMNKEVNWNNDTKTVTLTSEGLTVTDADTFKGNETTTDIGLEKAKEIALKHAGLKESEVTRLKAERDRDDGIVKYDVEFMKGRMEYDYEIHAETGKILKAEKEYDD